MTFLPFSCLNLIHTRSISPHSELPTVPMASALASSPMFWGLRMASVIRCWRLESIYSSPKAVPRHLQIHFLRPGVDAAAEATHVFKTMTEKVSRRVKGLLSLMVANDKELCARPAAQNLLHNVLGHQNGAFNMDGFVFLASAA